MCLLPACGQSSAATASGDCRPSPAQRADALPARLQGTLCEEGDELALSAPKQSDDAARGIVHLHLREGSGNYTVSVLEYVGGQLAPVTTSQQASTFELDRAAPDGYFIPYFHDYDDDRMTFALAGTPGRVALDIDRPLLPPDLDCEPQYEGLPVKTPPLSLPADFELELCSGRDSRVWAVTVDAGRPVHVTLENPESIDNTSIGACRDEAPCAPWPVAEGLATTRLGRAASTSWTFTPAEAGVVAFYGAGGISRAEPSRLHIEQP